MQIFVVSMVKSKIIMGVYTTHRKAMAHAEAIGRHTGEAVVFEFELNNDGVEDDESQDESGAVRDKSPQGPKKVSEKDETTHAESGVQTPAKRQANSIYKGV